MGLMYKCEMCGGEIRPHDGTLTRPQPCRQCLKQKVKQLQTELKRMLLWHDAVREVHPIVPSPHFIASVREAVEEEKGNDD